jgi:hypothetical protein
MTKREQHLVLLAGIVIVGWLAFHFWPRTTQSSEINENNAFRLVEADRLFRARQNIMAQSKAVTAELKRVKERFYIAANPENAKISLLKAVEGIAMQTNLAVQQKNMVSIHDDTIGVALEGKTSPESLICFLQMTAQSPIGIRIYRLQIHSIPESKQLNYQVTVISLLVK